MSEARIVEINAPRYDRDSGCEPMLLFWYVEPGDTVEAGQDLCEIESAKAVVVITAPCAGVLEEIAVGETAPVESEQLLGRIRPGASVAATAPPATLRFLLIGAPKQCAKCTACEAMAARLQERFPGRLDYAKHITNDPEAAEFGVVMPPFMVVDNLIVAMGAVPDEERLAELIQKKLEPLA